MKRIVTIQDISCLGKCSLTVALPVISAMGVETAILPTAVLSTHTMFQGYTIKNIEDQIEPITEHWKKLGMEFDAIYTGYLASPKQIDLVRAVFKTFEHENLIRFVDPAMADNGKLYVGFPQDFPQKMAQLCADADIILPNITEACLMTGLEQKSEFDDAYIHEVLSRLAQLGTRKAVVLTGVTSEKGKTGVSGLDVTTGEYFGFAHEKIPVSYHGTGDIFSSTTLGGLMRGLPLERALELAAEFTVAAISETVENDPEKTYGVDFEAVLPKLIGRLDEELALELRAKGDGTEFFDRE